MLTLPILPIRKQTFLVMNFIAKSHYFLCRMAVLVLTLPIFTAIRKQIVLVVNFIAKLKMIF